MNSLFAADLPAWAFEVVPEWLGTSLKVLVVLAGVVTLLGIVSKAPYVSRPLKWVWCRLISQPIGGWSSGVVFDVVAPRLKSQDAQLSNLTDVLTVSESNQEDIKASLKNIHECIDRRSAENHAAVAKLTEYTEEVLAEAVGAKERIRQLYKSLDIPVFESDALGHFTYVNPAFTKITGLAADQAIGEGWAEALESEDRPRVFMAWDSATGSEIDFNSVFRYKNMVTGTVTRVRGSAKPLHDGRGRVVGWVGTLDIVGQE